jgi:hypothetical protein
VATEAGRAPSEFAALKVVAVDRKAGIVCGIPFYQWRANSDITRDVF